MLLLDTNICIYMINANRPSVTLKLKENDVRNLKISSITVGELFFGIEKSQRKEENEHRIRKFLSPFEIIDFNSNDAIRYARIRSTLQKKGNLIGPYDMLIAAQAISRSWTIITNHEKEFTRVEGLKVENWVK